MRIAFISDIHEDVEQLQRVLRYAEIQRVEEMICMGDISGYSGVSHSFSGGRSASACLNLVRKYCSHIIAGNHDLHSTYRLPEYNPLFSFPKNWFQLPLDEQKALGEGQVWLYSDILEPDFTEEQLHFISALPEFKVEKLDKINFLLSHYLYPNTSGTSVGFYTQSDDFLKHKAFMKEQNCFFSFSGHFHYPGLFVSKANGILEQAENAVYRFDTMDSIIVPPVVRSEKGSGFLVFDTQEMHIELHRL